MKILILGFVVGFTIIGMTGCASNKVIVDDDSCSARVSVSGKNIKICDKLDL